LAIPIIHNLSPNSGIKFEEFSKARAKWRGFATTGEKVDENSFFRAYVTSKIRNMVIPYLLKLLIQGASERFIIDMLNKPE
jgi:hypothetical protein